MRKVSLNTKTSWGPVASWYKNTIDAKFSYQKDLILPELFKFFPKVNFKDKTVLDLGCGTGFFTREIAYQKPELVLGIDVGEELLQIAREYNKSFSNVKFQNLPAEDMYTLPKESFDLCLSVESLVNIKNLKKAVKELSQVMKKGGKVVAVVNHPAFRIPQSADWYYELRANKQGRVVYKYLTSHEIKIDMNPGSKVGKKFTYTYHRPFSEYVNTFAENEFYLNKVAEICSPKTSGKGPRQKAENIGRAEIPLFMFMEFTKT